MNWSISNIKNPDYTENHELYVGTSNGTFKRLVPAVKKNPFGLCDLYDINLLKNNADVTALSFGKDTSEIFIGRTMESVHIHSLRSDKVERRIEIKSAPVVGLARFDDYLVAGSFNGQVECVPLDDKSDTGFIFSSGSHMTHLRQCPTDRNLVATGGQGHQNNLKVFDIAAHGKQVFSSKNVANDELQLEVPVWDSDVGFIGSPHTLATCSRYGYVRVYDTRKQRRPVQSYTTQHQASFTTLAVHGNYIYTGTTMGSLRAFDIRRMKTFVHTYKGFIGSITDVALDSTGKYLASSSLDRYVRVHNAETTVMQYQCYVKSKATRVLIRESAVDPNSSATEAIEEDVDDLERLTKLHKKDQSTMPEDKEYEDIFENMQTICENDEENDISDSGEEKDAAEADDNSTKAGAKRKAKKKLSTSKKKK